MAKWSNLTGSSSVVIHEALKFVLLVVGNRWAIVMLMNTADDLLHVHLVTKRIFFRSQWRDRCLMI